MSAELRRLLPHRPPMLLLDRVEATDDADCVASWTVPGDSPWVEDGRLRRAAMVEIAAQAAAVCGATSAATRHAEGAPPARGLLGGVSDFRFLGDARSGDVLRCTATRIAQFGAAARFACRIERVTETASEPLARGDLTVVGGRV